jgi:hypothetical protein
MRGPLFGHFAAIIENSPGGCLSVSCAIVPQLHAGEQLAMKKFVHEHFALMHKLFLYQRADAAPPPSRLFIVPWAG